DPVIATKYATSMAHSWVAKTEDFLDVFDIGRPPHDLHMVHTAGAHADCLLAGRAAGAGKGGPGVRACLRAWRGRSTSSPSTARLLPVRGCCGMRRALPLRPPGA